MSTPSIDEPLTAIVIDDQPAVRTLLTRLLSRQQLVVKAFATADEARTAVLKADLSRAPVDLVLLDMRLDRNSADVHEAEALLKSLANRQPQTSVVVMSGHLSSTDFMRLVMMGASDYAAKPWDARDIVRRAYEWAVIGRRRYVHHHRLAKTPSRPERVAFLSYSSKDKELALGLKRVLELMGISTWYAPADVKPGEPWPEILEYAIGQCAVFLALMTEHSLASQQVAHEVERALKRREVERDGFLLVPVARGVLLDALPGPLQRFQAVDLSDESALIDNIMNLADRIAHFVDEHALPSKHRRSSERRSPIDRRGKVVIDGEERSDANSSSARVSPH